MYREKSWKKIERQKEKERKSAHWFRSDEKSKTCEFPIFCPYTRNSELLQRWRNITENITTQSKWMIKPKIIEQGGTSLKSILCNSSPRELDTCNDEECHVCTSDVNQRPMCRKTSRGGIGYEIQCMECDEEGKVSLYHGETSRTLYTRIKEHMRQTTNTTNEIRQPLLKHNTIFHPGKEIKFNVRKTGNFRDPLSRQINEGIRINNTRSDPGLLMNSKSEFHQGQVPRVVITTGL